jgi:hypothetical protein
MSGICKERHRIADDAVGAFNQHKSKVESDTNGKRGSKTRHRVAVALPRCVIVMCCHTFRRPCLVSPIGTSSSH